MSEYRRRNGGRSGAARNASGGTRRSAGAQRQQNARRRAPASNRRNDNEIRVPMWLGIAIIAVTVLVVVLISVKLLGGFGTDKTAAPAAAPAATATVEPAATEETPEAQGDAALPDATEEAPSVEGDAEPGSADPAAVPQATASTGSGTATGLRSATIRMAGDVIIDTEMLDACYDKASGTYNFDPYFSLIGDTLSSADYTMINIEASLRKGKYGYSGYPQFTTPPVILNVIKKYGVDMVTMCNNHMLDAYCDGLVESVGLVEAAGLDHIGGFVDKADSESPEIYEINGIKVGFVTYTHSTNTMEKYCDERAAYLVHYFKNSNCASDIAKARAAGAEVVVAVTHWGDEYKRAPESTTRKYAQALVAAGADVIIGGHPHMVQPAEYVTVTNANGESRTALCLYSLGNFLSQHRIQYTDSGVVFEFTIQENSDGTFSITEPGYVPVYVWTFKNSNGDDDYRVLAMGASLENRPEGMSDDQYNHMKECLQETFEVMGSDTVIKALKR